MTMKIVRTPLEPRITKVEFKGHEEKELLTWWHGELIKGRGLIFQPKVLVCFRVLGPNNELTNDFVHKPIGLTELGQFRIGTIWRNQTCRQQIKLDIETFQLDFDPDTWRYYSTAQNADDGRQSLIPEDVYELHSVYRHDRTWFLQFPFSNDSVGLLLPCLEFFSRCYGRSQHVKRVLSTYPWVVARQELLAPLIVPAPTGTWPINMKSDVPRGALLAQIDTPKGHFHFFEIQRRPRTIKQEDERERHGDHPFRGLVFSLTAPAALKDWVKRLLDRIRYTSGVLTGIAMGYPGEAFAFKHVPATTEKFPQERAVVRALSLMRVEIPAEPVAIQLSSPSKTAAQEK